MARITKDEYYLDIALAVSKRSTCIKRHYGCVIVKDDIIIATGYNGSPRGEETVVTEAHVKEQMLRGIQDTKVVIVFMQNRMH